MKRRKKQSGSGWKGLTAGLVGGLVGAWTMDVFQSYWSEVAEAQRKSREPDPVRPDQQSSKAADEDPTTVKAADAISRALFHHTLAPSEKQVAGAAAHYAVAIFTGGLYGIAAEYGPIVTVGGAIWGACVWMASDNFVLPLFGLAQWPNEYPLNVHAYALSSHLVYGVSAELVRRVVRPSLE